jgi:hypothetical protein
MNRRVAAGLSLRFAGPAFLRITQPEGFGYRFSMNDKKIPPHLPILSRHKGGGGEDISQTNV